MDQRREVLVTNLDEAFGPKEHLSSYNLKNKWRVLPYQTEKFEGRALCCWSGSPEDVSYDPQLHGWYKIYVSGRLSVMLMKLTSDPTYLTIARSPMEAAPGQFIEECLWRCADMTGESIFLSRKRLADENYHSNLASIRFVPMTEEEVAAYKAEEARTDTKRIFATDDMHNRLFFLNMKSKEDWYPVVLKYLHSDVEWISMEQVRSICSGKCPVDNLDEVNFNRAGDRRVQEQFDPEEYQHVLTELVKLGHEHGFKMSVSFRMGAWGMGYPYDQCYFDTPFARAHPQWHCMDRNGEMMSAMSYAYPEVQDYVINELLDMARTGCDAVTLIAHRGIPYVLFEKPVADRFFELYGEYPYELPLDEPRLHKLHVEIMTGFARRARKALDEEFGKDKVKIQLRSLHSILDTDYIGIDVEAWAREGILSEIITYPMSHAEKLDGDVWQEGKEFQRIDLDKYTRYIHENCRDAIYHIDPVEKDYLKGYRNYRGEICGPTSLKESVEQWMELERKYGVKMYFEILPRLMEPEEFQQRALELYECGAERFSLWDAYMRACCCGMWNVAGKLGHKEELRSRDCSPDACYRIWKVRTIDGVDFSRYSPTWGG